MSSRVVPAIALSLVVLLGGVGPVVGVGGVASVESAASVGQVTSVGPVTSVDSSSSVGHAEENTSAQYKVSLDNVTIETWVLRNATVQNATVDEVVVRNVTTSNGVRENVTLQNVTVERFFFERGRLENVTARKLVIRNKSVLNVPGGDFFDPDVEDRTIERQRTVNSTVVGVTIDRIVVDAATLCQNTSLGEEAEDSAQFDPRTDDEKPDITVQNGTVGNAFVLRGSASNWSVGSVDGPRATDGTLPDACNRGQSRDGQS